MSMQFQLVGKDGAWQSVSADRVEEPALFFTSDEALAAIPELAQSLGCAHSEIEVIERPELADEDLIAIWDLDRDVANEAMSVTDIAVKSGWHADTEEPDGGWDDFFADATERVLDQLRVRFPNAAIELDLGLFDDATENDNYLQVDAPARIARRLARRVVTEIVGACLEWHGTADDWEI
jgi:hypothetical protein